MAGDVSESDGKLRAGILLVLLLSQMCQLDDDSKKLGFYGVQSGMEVKAFVVVACSRDRSVYD